MTDDPRLLPLLALGLALIVLSFVVRVPLQGVLGVIVTAVISMGLFIAGVALVANQWIRMRRFKDE